MFLATVSLYLLSLHDALPSLRWAMTPRVSFAAVARTFGYERPAADGYFAPKNYLLVEGTVRGALGGEVGWRLDTDIGAGRQTIRAVDDARAARFAQRASGELGVGPAPGGGRG